MLIHKTTVMLRTKCVLRLMSFNVQSTCQASFKKDSTKGNRKKKLMKEFKTVFGQLVETKAEKKKRLKLEEKGKIPQQESNQNNTELFWVLENCHKNLQSITVPAKSKDEVFESQIVKNEKNISLPEKNETVREIDDEISNQTCNLSVMTKASSNKNRNKVISAMETLCPDQNVKEDGNIHNNASLPNSNVSNMENANAKYNVHSNSERPSNIIIKNLLSFPIISNKQESFKESTQSTEILSISGLDDPKTFKFPSVTKILTHTMPLESKLALEAWKKRMIEKLGEEGFEMHQKALLEDGASLHTCIAQNLLGKEFELPPRIEPVFKSVQSVLEDVCQVKAIETHVAHTKLHYKGVIDCVASYRGENYVIDWKKSDKKKLNLKETYDGPAQVAAYIGAINASNLYPFVIKRGLLVIAYTCGTPASVHEICNNTLQHYWTIWLHRLQKYYVETANNDDNENIPQ
ncbi:hypothetical protein X777_12536 [Ooceraea biroi]|uniref:Mitochondrial genome maintenance exonuclease 1 n=1 Tax=Ooceraea biroi TaxID=2015173 RepID=A0A026VZC2_OOCBI|nr:hypothetical protein X777_12536 [Ooceraea biroi]